MSECISILNEIKSGGYEASLITTYNAYLPFYEDVVLRHLMGNGIRHNVLMMDAVQATLAVDRHPPRTAGRLYTLAPVKVAGAFHPKVILLVGKKKGTLLVGSHNLTLSGFGYNREMTNVIRCKGEGDVEAAALLYSAWQQLLGWAESQSNALPGHIIDMVKKVRDFAPWLQDTAGVSPENCRVLSAAADAPPLWQQFTEFAGPGPVEKVIVSGAFFDANLAFVERVRDELAPKSLVVGIDPDSVQFPVGKKLPGVSFVNSARLGAAEQDDKQAGYLHAKSILIEREDGETVLAVGSANPSYPAWLAPGMTQNVEMMIARKGDDAREAAEELGLLAVGSMPPVAEDEWQTIQRNWAREDSADQSGEAPHVVIALASDSDIRFRLPAGNSPSTIECEVFGAAAEVIAKRQAILSGGEYLLVTAGLQTPALILRFNVLESSFTALVQHVKQVEGLSRTSSQRRFNEALSSLATGMPNLEHFVDCVKEIIKISDTVTAHRGTVAATTPRRNSETVETAGEGAELSIALEDVVEQENRRKQKLRGSDDLGYLLDVLLYNLRDESPIGLEDVLEERDAQGRSEEEQVDADDEEEIVLPPAVEDDNGRDVPPTRNPLNVCHYKVGSLVGLACEKLEALKQDKLELPQFVVIMAGILSALRLLRGLDGKVPWIGAGQTAVPQKELQRLYSKNSEVAFDGDKSILCANSNFSQLVGFDEFDRLKGLIIWLAWESGITFADQKPFNESQEERSARLDTNRLYVATAQIIAGDSDVINEARQSIGQFSLSEMNWLERLLAVDEFFRAACGGSIELESGGPLKAGDFGFNATKPWLGVREVLPRGAGQLALGAHNANRPRFVFPAGDIQVLLFERIKGISQKFV